MGKQIRKRATPVRKYPHAWALTLESGAGLVSPLLTVFDAGLCRAQTQGDMKARKHGFLTGKQTHKLLCAQTQHQVTLGPFLSTWTPFVTSLFLKCNLIFSSLVLSVQDYIRKEGSCVALF
jgi:hypothetical protein